MTTERKAGVLATVSMAVTTSVMAESVAGSMKTGALAKRFDCDARRVSPAPLSPSSVSRRVAKRCRSSVTHMHSALAQSAAFPSACSAAQLSVLSSHGIIRFHQ